MDKHNNLNYIRVAKAIEFINAYHTQQPSLETIAEHVHLSPMHFQRLFTEWAGTSPIKFLQYISINYAKKLLTKNGNTLFETALESGYSSTSRLHDLFVSIEGMTPNEYKNGGKNLLIEYQFASSPFGNILIASTSKGICNITFEKDKESGVNQLKSNFEHAQFVEKKNEFHQSALSIFNNNWDDLPKIKLHLKGTEFQLKVWEALLKIPLGSLKTYGHIAESIGLPTASRAVGTAIGSNPIAFIIPCHRVIQATGKIGGYMWGPTRKACIIGWEGAQIEIK